MVHGTSDLGLIVVGDIRRLKHGIGRSETYGGSSGLVQIAGSTRGTNRKVMASQGQIAAGSIIGSQLNCGAVWGAYRERRGG